MDLWIRTQDKRQLLKVNDGLYIANGFSDTHDTFIGIKNVGHIGRYAKVERALEVLDEISNKVKNQYLVKINGLIRKSDMEKERIYLEKEYNGEFIMNPPMYDINPINPNIIYYEMPKE